MEPAGEQRAARRLPRGQHGIPPEVVARNQRERLIAAMAESCAERGYAESSVADVVKRAGVSSLTFYKRFSDKRDCLLAAHRQLLGRLLEALDAAREAAEGKAGARERRRVTLEATLSLLAADPPAARLLTVEILAAGPEGVKRHDAMVAELAERLGEAGECAPGSGEDRGGEPSPAEWARVAGLLALVGKLVIAGEADRVPTQATAYV